MLIISLNLLLPNARDHQPPEPTAATVSQAAAVRNAENMSGTPMPQEGSLGSDLERVGHGFDRGPHCGGVFRAALRQFAAQGVDRTRNIRVAGEISR